MCVLDVFGVCWMCVWFVVVFSRLAAMSFLICCCLQPDHLVETYN